MARPSQGQARHVRETLTAEEAGMAETTARLSTSGMHCRSCSMLIDMTLGDLEGVSESSTDHVGGTTEVTFDPDVVTLEEIVSAIQGTGYDAEPGS